MLVRDPSGTAADNTALYRRYAALVNRKMI